MLLTRRRFHRYLLGGLGGALGATLWTPALAELVEGRDWGPIEPPQPSDRPGVIEVLEFFSYACPHCSHLNRVIVPWSRKLPAGVSFRRVPVSFGRTAWTNLARLYYSLEITGDLERLDQAVFEALHQQRTRLFTKADILDWLSERGVDAKAFAEVFDSFDIETKVSRGDYLVGEYRIDAVPRIVVAGRYAVLGRAAQGFPELLGIADALIARAQAAGGAT